MKNLILIFVLCIFCAGCRVKKTDIKQEIKTEKDSGFNKENEAKTNEVFQQQNGEKQTVKAVETNIENFEITPVDNSKPMEIINSKGEKLIVNNGKVNVGKKHIKENSASTSKNAASTTSKTTAAKSSENGFANEKSDAKLQAHTESKPSSIGYFFMLFILILLFIIGYFLNKYYDKINFKNLLGNVIAVFKK
ncbi:MAG: hypothetical protein V4547_16320 [Bacteroidota bacterium]